MTDSSKPKGGVGKLLESAVDAEAAKLRLAKRAFDAVDASKAIYGIAKAAKGGGKLSRSETVTVRLDPKLRYLAELAARMHRRTLSSYIEWAIVGSLADNVIKSDSADPSGGPSISDEAEYLWDVDEADRFARLAFRHPHLLTHEEQVLWKVIRECSYLWNGSYDAAEKWTWRPEQASLDFQKLRTYWPSLVAVAAGTLGRDSLPTWPDGEPSNHRGPAARQTTKVAFSDMGDDLSS